MASRPESQGLGNGPADQPSTGIEDHLRSLILAHDPPAERRPGAPDPLAFPRLEPTHRRAASALEPPNPPAGPSSTSNANAGAPGHPLPSSPLPSSPKAAKRRPNQAQRRQMSAQLMITPDSEPPRQSQAHQAWPAPRHQRHTPTHSYPSRPIPPPSPQWRDDDGPRAFNNSWRGPRHPHAHSSQRPLDHPENPAPHYANPFANARPGYRHASGNAYPDYRSQMAPKFIARQADYLQMLCGPTVSGAEIEIHEIAHNESFRRRIEEISRQVVARFERDQFADLDFPAQSVQLKCFGSLASGFATKDSDMDLGLLSPYSHIQPDAPGSPIPRLLEKAFLEAGLGARLLSRTRVPIIKLCESPPEALRQRLLNARARWEAGQEYERPNGPEEAPEQDSPSRLDEDEQHQELPGHSPDASSLGAFQVPCRQTGKPQTFHLRQHARCSFHAYCNLTHRLLKKAGGRDVTSTNHRKFSDVDWEILNRVCHAFICGLSDDRLRKRLVDLGYPSLPLSDKPQTPQTSYFRSLGGLMIQVEGEHILQAWDDWPHRDLFMHSNPRDDQILREWTALQHRSTSNADMLAYFRDLEAALAKIKMIPTIQLLLLEQGEQEPPFQFGRRVEVIRASLGDLGTEVERVIASQYISGIRPGHVRDAVVAYLDANPDQSVLQPIACRHRSLALAQDLERALAERLFETDNIASMTKYVEDLRSPLVQGPKGYVVPLSPDSDRAVAALKALKDLQVLLPSPARGRHHDPLQFPKSGVGAQCDINFSAHLALQNTALLRCYTLADPRVKPMVIFVKHWAKVRGINSGYLGTLSSYGYVLMVLHYLVHVAQPFVCPNLQKISPTTWPFMSPNEIEATTTCRGYDIRFWRDEHEILHLALANQLTQNTASLGELLRGFFEYFANSGNMSTVPRRGFDWGREVLSLRTQGGLLSKQVKGWVHAKTVFADEGSPADSGQSQDPRSQASTQVPGAVVEPEGNNHQPKTEQPIAKGQNVKEIRLRYLLAIEDPFEIDHNVARTVTHDGIVSIRDEFRRAWRILQALGNEQPAAELLNDVRETQRGSNDISLLLEDIHGTDVRRSEESTGPISGGGR